MSLMPRIASIGHRSWDARYTPPDSTLELDTARVRLLAQRANQRAPMFDEEFQREIEALGRDALDTLSVEELEAALARKRARPAADERPARG